MNELGCGYCKHIRKIEDQYPCCQCKNSHFSFWEMGTCNGAKNDDEYSTEEGMNELHCDNCKYTDKAEDEYPCSNCKHAQISRFEPADTNDGANHGYDYSTETHDPVNYPSHYTQGAMETIEIIQAITDTMDGFRAYCVGNVLKYIARHEHKNGVEDLKKAAWYLNRLIEEGEGDE